MTGMYIAIQNRLISEYDVTLCDGMKNGRKCTYYNFSHPHRCAYHKGSKYRRIRNWQQKDTLWSTLILLHEIGHLQRHYSNKVEDEYRASEWALKKSIELHITPDRQMVTSLQRDIIRYHDQYAEKFKDFELFGLEKPDWFKDREYYNLTRLYDQLKAEKSSGHCQITPLYPAERK